MLSDNVLGHLVDDNHVLGVTKSQLSNLISLIKSNVKKKRTVSQYLIYSHGCVYATNGAIMLRYVTPELFEKFGDTVMRVGLESLQKTFRVMTASDVTAWDTFAWVALDDNVSSDVKEFYTRVIEQPFNRTFYTAEKFAMPALNPSSLGTLCSLLDYSAKSDVHTRPVRLASSAPDFSLNQPWGIFVAGLDVMGVIAPLYKSEWNDSAHWNKSRVDVDTDLTRITEGYPPDDPSDESPVDTDDSGTEVTVVNSDTSTSETVSVVESTIARGSNTCAEFSSFEGKVFRFGRLHNRIAYVKVSDDKKLIVVARKNGYVTGSDSEGEKRLNEFLLSLNVTLGA